MRSIKVQRAAKPQDSDLNITFAAPAGSLQKGFLELCGECGIKLTARDRSQKLHSSDPHIEAHLFRSQEIGTYVAQGHLDAGAAGFDWIAETGAEVVQIGDELIFSKRTHQPAKWVLAVPEDSSIKRAEDLDGKTISTELVNTTTQFFKNRGVAPVVEFSWGATEVKCNRLGAKGGKGKPVADGIVDVTETGTSLRENKLRIIEEVLVSTPRFIANKESIKDSGKRKTIESFAMALQSVLHGKEMIRLDMQVSVRNANRVANILDEKASRIRWTNTSDKNVKAVSAIAELSDWRSLSSELHNAKAFDVSARELDLAVPNEVPAMKMLNPSTEHKGLLDVVSPDSLKNLIGFSKKKRYIPCSVFDEGTTRPLATGLLTAADFDRTVATGSLALTQVTQLRCKASEADMLLRVSSMQLAKDCNSILIKVRTVGPSNGTGRPSIYTGPYTNFKSSSGN